jgi:hypothetical protein
LFILIGQRDEGIGVIGNYYLLSLHEELLENKEFEDFEVVEPVGPVKKGIWSKPHIRIVVF